MIRVVIADDHTIVREGLKQLLARRRRPRGRRRGGATATRCCARVRALDFDVLLLDMSMPGKSGIELIKQVQGGEAEAAHPRAQHARGAPVRGARDPGRRRRATSPRRAPRTQLVDGDPQGRRRAARSSAPRWPSSSRWRAMPHAEGPPHAALSDREFQVFQLLVAGAGVSDIAASSTSRCKTVSTHKARLMEKMGIANQAELIRYALKHRPDRRPQRAEPDARDGVGGSPTPPAAGADPRNQVLPMRRNRTSADRRRRTPVPILGSMASNAPQVFIVDDSAVDARRACAELAATTSTASTIVGEAGDPRRRDCGHPAPRIPHACCSTTSSRAAPALDVLRAVHAQAPDTVFIVLTNHAAAVPPRVHGRRRAVTFSTRSSEFGRISGRDRRTRAAAALTLRRMPHRGALHGSPRASPNAASVAREGPILRRAALHDVEPPAAELHDLQHAAVVCMPGGLEPEDLARDRRSSSPSASGCARARRCSGRARSSRRSTRSALGSCQDGAARRGRPRPGVRLPHGGRRDRHRRHRRRAPRLPGDRARGHAKSARIPFQRIEELEHAEPAGAAEHAPDAGATRSRRERRVMLMLGTHARRPAARGLPARPRASATTRAATRRPSSCCG